MAGAKEIRSKIASIKSTQKITSAMEKVAVSKMRKAQMRMAASRPYAERIAGDWPLANTSLNTVIRSWLSVRSSVSATSSSRPIVESGLNTNLFRR